MNQQELGEVFDVCKETISKWENDVKTPDIKYMPKLIEWLGKIPPFKKQKNELAQKIYNYRMIHGIPVREFAQLVKISTWTIAKINNGESVSFDIEMKIQEYIN